MENRFPNINTATSPPDQEGTLQPNVDVFRGVPRDPEYGGVALTTTVSNPSNEKTTYGQGLHNQAVTDSQQASAPGEAKPKRPDDN